MKQQKRDFVQLFEAAVKAAKAANGDDSPQVTRCVSALRRLKEAPESVACDVLSTTPMGLSHGLLVKHKNPRISSVSKDLWGLWMRYLYATGKPKKTQDSKRDRVREILRTKLAMVATEVVETEMKKRVSGCDPWAVAVSVESALFHKLGCFSGPKKLRYRSILLNMGDTSNPDLRRKVLVGEISGERLVSMEVHEMASHKMQMEAAQIKERARFREESRILFQSDMTVMSS